MINLIEMEFLKEKRSKIMTLSILGALCLPLMMLIGLLHHKIIDPTLIYTFKEIYDDIILYFFMLFSVIIFSLMISHLISIDYKQHTLKSILTNPISKNKYIFCKVIVCIIWALVLSLLTFLTTTIVGFAVEADGMSLSLFIEYLTRFCESGFLLSLSMIPFVFITLVFKNVIAPVILGVVISLSNSIIISSDFAQFSPYCSPLLYATQEIGTYNYMSLFIILLTFLVGFIISVVYFNIKDVDI